MTIFHALWEGSAGGKPSAVGPLGRAFTGLAAGALLLQSCLLPPADTTPLRASEVRVNLDVISRHSEAGGGGGYFEARFFDHEDRRTGLREGHVSLNGQRMRETTGPYYYQLSSNDDALPFRFHFDSLYTFRIVLDTASGIEYVCTVRTQKHPLTSRAVTLVDDSARVTWVGDTTLPVRLNYALSNDGSGSVSRSRTFPPPHVNEVRVPLDGYSSFNLTRLETVVTGVVDSAFRSGSLESMVRLEY